MTITGCLQRAEGTPVGTSGSTSGSDANARLILANARIGGAPGGGSAVTSPAPPGSGTSDSAVRAGSVAPSPNLTGATNSNGERDKSDSNRYLIRSDNPEVPRHVGQEVEVSGYLHPAASTSASPSAAQAAPMSEFEVKTLRMLASVCVAP